jgi:hypothetical protein
VSTLDGLSFVIGDVASNGSPTILVVDFFRQAAAPFTVCLPSGIDAARTVCPEDRHRRECKRAEYRSKDSRADECAQGKINLCSK